MAAETALELQIKANSEQAIQALGGLADALGRVKSALSKGFNTQSQTKKLSEFGNTINTAFTEDSIARVERLASALERLKAVGTVKVKLSKGAQQALQTQPIQDALSAAKESAMEQAGGDTGLSSASSGWARLKERVAAATGEIKKFAGGLLSAIREAGKGSGVISNLASSFGRIAYYRSIRTAIKEIGEGFKTGIANVREYSKAIGSEFNQAMTAANDATFKMKNSLGAALAPALMSLVPVLQTIVSWVITAANALNQLFALLRGQSTWTRATNAAAASMDKVKASAGGAGGAIKDLLADWDELNIIQSQSGGGGGGGGGYLPIDYASMFEEVGEFDRRIRNIVNWIKRTINWIKDNWEDIEGIVKNIGVAIGAWTLGGAIGGWLGWLIQAAAVGAIIPITFQVSTFLAGKYLDTGETGYLIADIIAPMLGSFLAWKATKSLLGSHVGNKANVMIGLTLTISAIADLVALLGNTDVTALSKESLRLSLASAAKLGAGVAFMLSKPLGLVKGIGAGAGSALVWLGVSVGAKAILDTFDSGDITIDTIKAGIISSVATGLGAALIAGAAGAGIAGAAIAGAIGFVATGLVVAAGVGVAVALSTKKENVRWGNIHLTQKEIEAFVNSELLPADIDVKANLVKVAVDNATEVKLSLADAATGLVVPINSLKLKVNQEDALASLKTQVFGTDGEGGLIGDFKTYAASQQTLVETMIAISPIFDENGNNVSADAMSKSIEGWAGLEAIMDQYGADLSTHLAESMNENLPKELRDREARMAAEIADTMRRITLAATGGGSDSVLKDYEYDISLADLDKSSFKKAVELYNQRIEDYKKEVRDAKLAAAQTFKNQSEAYRVAAESATSETVRAEYQAKADEYKGLFEDYYKAALEGIDMATDETAQKAKEKLRKWVEDVIVDTTAIEAIPEDLFDIANAWGNGNVQTSIREMVEAITGIPTYVLEALETTGWDYLSDAAKGKVVEVLAGMFDRDELESELKKLNIEADIPVVPKPEINEQAAVGAEDEIAAKWAETHQKVKDAVAEPIPAPDTSQFTSGMIDAANTAVGQVDRIRQAIASLNSIRIGFSGGAITSSIIGPSILHRAGGGMVTTGQMFMARENGMTEYIGSIGNKTGVANNDQIVSGIAGGVAQGQAEQNSLLRQQNNLLVALLNKKFEAEVKPSAGLGRVNAQSARMYERTTG